MKKKLKDKWLAALRSGEYKQGISKLRSADNKFCCLGVLCEVAGLQSSLFDDEYYCYTYESDRDESELPFSFRREIGLDIRVQNSLINMNDNEDKSFDKIAQWIEVNIPYEE